VALYLHSPNTPSWRGAQFDNFLPFTFENRVLRILAPKREEVEGGWTRLHNEELQQILG
jgi:hypothetical protein